MCASKSPITPLRAADGSAGGNQEESTSASAPAVVPRYASSAAMLGSSRSAPVSVSASAREMSVGSACASAIAESIGSLLIGSTSRSGARQRADARAAVSGRPDSSRAGSSPSASGGSSQPPSWTGITHSSLSCVCVRPPTRSRASRTVTSRSRSASPAATVAPARPAPITAIRSPAIAAARMRIAALSPEWIAPRMVAGLSASVASPAKKTRPSTGSARRLRASACTPMRL